MKKCTQSTALAPGPTTENASPLCLGGSDRGGWRPPSPSPGLCAPCGHPASARGITVELRAHFPLTLCPEGVLALVQGGSHSVSERHSRWSPGPLSLPVEYPGPPALLGRLHSKPPPPLCPCGPRRPLLGWGRCSGSQGCPQEPGAGPSCHHSSSPGRDWLQW